MQYLCSTHRRDSRLGTEHHASGLTSPEMDEKNVETGVLALAGLTALSLWKGRQTSLVQYSWLRSRALLHLQPAGQLRMVAMKEFLAGVFQLSVGM